MSWSDSDEWLSPPQMETEWPECADLDVRTLPDARLALLSAPIQPMVPAASLTDDAAWLLIAGPRGVRSSRTARRPEFPVTAAYEVAGLSAADIAHVSNLVAAVESAGSPSPWVAVARADLMGVVAVVDRLVERSVVGGRFSVIGGPDPGDSVLAGSGKAAGILRDPTIMAGMPCVRGTRIPVVLVLRCLAELDPDRALADFPQLTRDDLAAVLLYAADALDGRDRP